jgi:hypothetical protein
VHLALVASALLGCYDLWRGRRVKRARDMPGVSSWKKDVVVPCADCRKRQGCLPPPTMLARASVPASLDNVARRQERDT